MQTQPSHNQEVVHEEFPLGHVYLEIIKSLYTFKLTITAPTVQYLLRANKSPQ